MPSTNSPMTTTEAKTQTTDEEPEGYERRTFFDDDKPSWNTYFESDKDFVLNNFELCLYLLKQKGLDPFFPIGEDDD